MAFLLNPLSPSQQNVPSSIVNFKLQQNTGSTAKRALLPLRKEGQPEKTTEKEVEEKPKVIQAKDPVPPKKQPKQSVPERFNFQAPIFKITKELKQAAIYSSPQFEEEVVPEQQYLSSIPQNSVNPFGSPKYKLSNKMKRNLNRMKHYKCDLFQSPSYVITDELRNNVPPVFPVLSSAVESELHPDMNDMMVE